MLKGLINNSHDPPLTGKKRHKNKSLLNIIPYYLSHLISPRKKGFVSINKLKKCGKYFPSKYVKFYVGFALVLISIYLFLLKMAIILCGLCSGAN
jgi:hypothetical protein